MSVYEASITNPKKQLEFYKDLSEQLLKENEKLKETETDLTLVYLKGYEDGKEKYNHYKLLYQKVKERNDKAIEYVEDNFIERMSGMPKGIYIASIRNLEELLEILKDNNEVNNDNN